jgi:hypothetical protein
MNVGRTQNAARYARTWNRDRRSGEADLLRSSRVRQQQQNGDGVGRSKNYGCYGEGGHLSGNGGGVMNGNANALPRNANGLTVPQKRKLGMSAGGGGARGSGSKARFEEDGARERGRVGDRGKGKMRPHFVASVGGEEGDEIRCRCRSNTDDGFSIACAVVSCCVLCDFEERAGAVGVLDVCAAESYR